MPEEAHKRLLLEMRRGVIVLAVMAELRTETYGYSLRKALAAAGVPVEESTLYPLVRRLEAQGLLTSEWRTEGKRKKRFYRLSDEGRVIFSELLADWRELNRGMAKLIEESES